MQELGVETDDKSALSGQYELKVLNYLQLHVVSLYPS